MRIWIAAAAAVLSLLVSVCAAEALSTGDLPVIEDEKFGGIYFEISNEDFANLGFVPGDSVDIRFSNGAALTDVPFYTGYYVKSGEPLLLTYPTNPYIEMQFNYGPSSWEKFEMAEGDTGCVTLAEAGRYRTVEETLCQERSEDRADYATDEAFGNFRPLGGVESGECAFYRSASPCLAGYIRSRCVDRLMEREGVDLVLNMGENDEETILLLNDGNFDSPYFAALYAQGNVISAGLGVSYTGDEFRNGLGNALRSILDHEGKILICCHEGKDRTGFVCALLEALAGADYRQLVDDYMISYDNYYGVNQTDTPERYNIYFKLNFEDMLRAIGNTDDPAGLEQADFRQGAIAYLESCGLTDQEIGILSRMLGYSAEQ